MANTRELRRRIRSVKNTAQITKAMEMVAATKMRKAQVATLSSRSYSTTLNLSLSDLLVNINTESHPLLQKNKSLIQGLALFSTDKSLCGALNTNLFRTTVNFLKDKKDVSFFTIGKKGRSFLIKLNKDLKADFENSEIVSFKEARQLAHLLIDAYLKNEICETYLIYPNFVSTLRQEPVVLKLLPIDLEALILEENKQSRKAENKNEFLFEPDPDTLLDFILVHSIETKLFQGLLETKASEYSARMVAMQNATNNAKDLVDDLNLLYNQTRQESITRELLEITSASAALE